MILFVLDQADKLGAGGCGSAGDGGVPLPGSVRSAGRVADRRGRRQVWDLAAVATHLAATLPARRHTGLGGSVAASAYQPESPAAEVEALICQLRRDHPRWGARRISYELGRSGVEPTPSRATTHRVLVRNGLIDPQAQQHKRKYRRWQRAEPMHLWQLDIVGGVPLADGRQCKMVTGIDDHSRFVVITTVVAVPTGRAVCEAFTAAMRRYGVPSEVLSDNGKQFTGKYTKPLPVEVLFERICRDNGITQRLTKPRSPTTTGKIERFHKTLRRSSSTTSRRSSPSPRRRKPSTVGSRATTSSGHTSHWTWPPRPACSAPTAPTGSKVLSPYWMNLRLTWRST